MALSHLRAVRWERLKPLSVLDRHEPLNLLPADIVFVMSDGFSGFMIRHFPGGLPGWLHRLLRRSRRAQLPEPNHVAMVVSSLGPQIMDAQPPRVRERRLQKYYAGQLVAIYRPLGLELYDRNRISAQCRSHYAGRRYGWSKIILQALGLARFSFIDALPICSYSVAEPFASNGIRCTDGEPNAATPESIYYHVRRLAV